MTEPMTESQENPKRRGEVGMHLPLAVFFVAVAVFFGAQVKSVNHGIDTLRWRMENFDRQLEKLESSKAQLESLHNQRGEMVTQAAAVEAQYTAFLEELLALSETDADAAKIVEKWQIKRQAPAVPGYRAAPSADSDGG